MQPDPRSAATKRVAEHLGYCPHSTPEDEAAGAAVLKLADANKRLAVALGEILDAAERAQAGFPIESEEWYARRDFARIVLKEAS